MRAAHGRRRHADGENGSPRGGSGGPAYTPAPGSGTSRTHAARATVLPPPPGRTQQRGHMLRARGALGPAAHHNCGRAGLPGRRDGPLPAPAPHDDTGRVHAPAAAVLPPAPAHDLRGRMRRDPGARGRAAHRNGGPHGPSDHHGGPLPVPAERDDAGRTHEPAATVLPPAPTLDLRGRMRREHGGRGRAAHRNGGPHGPPDHHGGPLPAPPKHDGAGRAHAPVADTKMPTARGSLRKRTHWRGKHRGGKHRGVGAPNTHRLKMRRRLLRL